MLSDAPACVQALMSCSHPETVRLRQIKSLFVFVFCSLFVRLCCYEARLLVCLFLYLFVVIWGLFVRYRGVVAGALCSDLFVCVLLLVVCLFVLLCML